LNNAILELPAFKMMEIDSTLSVIFSNRFRHTLHSRPIKVSPDWPVKNLFTYLRRLVVWLNPYQRTKVRVGQISEAIPVGFRRDEDDEEMELERTLSTYALGDDIISVIFDFELMQ